MPTPRVLILWGLALWVLQSQGSAAAFSLRLAIRNGATADSPALRAFVDQVERDLPPRVKAKLNRTILISFEQLDEQTQVAVPSCETYSSVDTSAGKTLPLLGKAVFPLQGQAPAEIKLHSGLLTLIESGRARSPTYACGHRSLYQLARATLLHEIIHIYDKLESVSARSRYQNLHRFARQGFRQTLKTRNTIQLRSPDRYEFASIRENFAVNAEYFLLDPEYKCRRPAVYDFFEQEFRYRPFPHFHCAIGLTVYAGDQPVHLDPERVYQVHYLWATAGSALESRWGHAMFRLILCAPDRIKVDEKCLQDVQYHVVVSFAANLGGELRISAWKGLTGGYLSQLFFRPLTEVIIEYTELEFRDLQSYPLLLSEAEKRQFIHHALELYWGYAGKYYFLTNNCASESASLIKSAARSPGAQELRSLTPAGLLKELLEKKLTSALAVRDAAAAEASGLLFRSLYDVYAGALAAIAQSLPKEAPRTLPRWLRNTRALQRRAWFSSASGPVDKVRAAHLFALEGLIMNTQRRDLEGKLLHLYEKSQTAKKYAPLRQTLRTLMQALRRNLPWQWTQGGYGVPLATELADVPAPTIERLFGTLQREAMQVLRIELPADYAEAMQIQENRTILMQQVLAPAPSENQVRRQAIASCRSQP